MAFSFYSYKDLQLLFKSDCKDTAILLSCKQLFKKNLYAIPNNLSLKDINIIIFCFAANYHLSAKEGFKAEFLRPS
ncbi:MAG: hypothetical protein EA411_01710 [Saprospirales bacterium]|nr:MAG: hypothetical protein EA411_01710 [Saprospirales bacterium]